MITNFLRVEELQILADEMDRQACLNEFERRARPTLTDKVSPDNYRSIFKVTEVLRVAYEFAKEQKIEEPFEAFLQASSKNNPRSHR
jgi:hypothetical protein